MSYKTAVKSVKTIRGNVKIAAGQEGRNAPGATQSALTYAAENGIDFMAIIGTGANGRILLSDVRTVD